MRLIGRSSGQDDIRQLLGDLVRTLPPRKSRFGSAANELGDSVVIVGVDLNEPASVVSDYVKSMQMTTC